MFDDSFYSYALLDPRGSPEAEENNEKIFSSARSSSSHVYGIEVTIPELAKRCVHNIDPQHTGGNAQCAAIEEALIADVPRLGSILVTIRADADSIGSMAVLHLRLIQQVKIHLDARKRIQMVANADKFAFGAWKNRTLPTRDNPWPENGSTEERQLAAISAASTDFTIPIRDRISIMERWIMTGKEPEGFRLRVEKERERLVSALETGQIKYETRSKIAVVESEHRSATWVGYSLAPVVVCYNPKFQQGGGEPHKKFTIAAYQQEYADIKSALFDLNEIENGWGGSPTIGGSPQGVSSKLTTDEVLTVVEKHLR